jgi:7-keto-8-aminopelargonate synthetase-like enzyme
MTDLTELEMRANEEARHSHRELVEELEAKLAKAVGALESLHVGEGWAAQIARTTLAELEGKGDE